MTTYENAPWDRDGWVCEPREPVPAPLTIPAGVVLGEN
jgi:hypothetical protein